MNEQILKEILSESKKITKLLSSLVAQEDSQKANILKLEKCGLSSNEIAEFLGTSLNTARVVISNSKKTAKK